MTPNNISILSRFVVSGRKTLIINFSKVRVNSLKARCCIYKSSISFIFLCIDIFYHTMMSQNFLSQLSDAKIFGKLEVL